MADKPDLQNPSELRAQAVEWALRVLQPKGNGMTTEEVISTAEKFESFIQGAKTSTSKGFIPAENLADPMKEIG